MYIYGPDMMLNPENSTLAIKTHIIHKNVKKAHKRIIQNVINRSDTTGSSSHVVLFIEIQPITGSHFNF